MVSAALSTTPRTTYWLGGDCTLYSSCNMFTPSPAMPREIRQVHFRIKHALIKLFTSHTKVRAGYYRLLCHSTQDQRGAEFMCFRGVESHTPHGRALPFVVVENFFVVVNNCLNPIFVNKVVPQDDEGLKTHHSASKFVQISWGVS